MNIFLIIACVLYVLWAAVPGVLAYKKGRCAWAYAVLGLIVTPLISTIVLLAKKTPAQENPEENGASEETDAEAEETTQEETVTEELPAETASEDETAEEAPVEEAPAKKTCNLTLWAIVLNVIFLLVIGALLFFGLREEEGQYFDADAPYGENDVTCRSNYAVLEAKPTDRTMNTIVAVNKDGEPVVTNAALNISYWVEFYNFLSSYGTYAYYFIDTTTPLDQQSALTGTGTWEQYFLDSATLAHEQNYALAQAAYARGYVPSEEEQASIDDITDPEGSLAQNSAASGYASPTEYIQMNFGTGVTLEDYQDYVRTYFAAYDEYTYLTEQAEAAVTDDQLQTYYDENEESFVASRVLDVNNVSVRHILLAPESGVSDATEEEWEATLAAAEELLAQWQADPTEDYFATLANEHSTDTGSNTTGGLYEDFASNAMVQTFSDWCFDASRQPGDTGIVKSDYGYHIIYFVGTTDTLGWQDVVREQMINEQLSAAIAATCETYPLAFDFNQVRIFDMISYAAANSTSAE